VSSGSLIGVYRMVLWRHNIKITPLAQILSGFSENGPFTTQIIKNARGYTNSLSIVNNLV